MTTNGIGLCEARQRQMTVLALPLIGGFCIARVISCLKKEKRRGDFFNNFFKI
jgi:hypothetical protein